MPEIYLMFLFFSFLLIVGIKLFPIFLKIERREEIDLSRITVVIPFRNEAENLSHFLESLFNQEHLPATVIFVNDHSSDDSMDIVKKFIETYSGAKLLTLPAEKAGKKEALNYGIHKSKSQFVLTLDADVVLHNSYFTALDKLTYNALFSLPVLMKGKTIFGKLFSTEYLFFNAFNFLLAPIWPISISGANLLFDINSVDYQKQLESHKEVSSGDDYFLLKHFRTKRLLIQVSNAYQLSVSTDAPKNIKAYFDQRVRWLSKSKHQINWTDVLIGFFIGVYFVGGFIALIFAAFYNDWMLFGSIFLLRFSLDTLVYLNYAQRLRSTKYVLLLPFFQLIYPLLFIGVLLLSLFYKPKWKGRTAT